MMGNDFINKTLLADNKTVSEEDLNLYIITDDMTEVMNIVKSSPIRAEISYKKQS